MDIIQLHGGSPANFLDVGGNVQEHQVLQAFKILTSGYSSYTSATIIFAQQLWYCQTDENVKAILVNVFGGIVNCGTIASGIVNASKTIGLNVPLIVRLEGNITFFICQLDPIRFVLHWFLKFVGNNVEAAKKIIADSGLPIQSATDLDNAAQKAVASI